MIFSFKMWESNFGCQNPVMQLRKQVIQIIASQTTCGEGPIFKNIFSSMLCIIIFITNNKNELPKNEKANRYSKFNHTFFVVIGFKQPHICSVNFYKMFTCFLWILVLASWYYQFQTSTSPWITYIKWITETSKIEKIV